MYTVIYMKMVEATQFYKSLLIISNFPVYRT